MKWVEDKSVHEGLGRVQGHKRTKRFQGLNDDRVKEIVETAKKEVLV